MFEDEDAIYAISWKGSGWYGVSEIVECFYVYQYIASADARSDVAMERCIQFSLDEVIYLLNRPRDLPDADEFLALYDPDEFINPLIQTDLP